jgi:hypothetical protein
VIAHTRLPAPGSIGGLLPAVSPSAAPTPDPGQRASGGRVTSVAAETAFAGPPPPDALILLTIAFAVALAGSAAGLGIARRTRKRRAR